jgi:4-hydroxybutyryl-CoA dehydratase/vinylacetyl-CoA-Delta-isomerase
MMNGKEYIDSLKDLNLEVYFFGQRIKSIVDEPMFQPHIHTAAMTYDLAHDPEYQEIMTATSHIKIITKSCYTKTTGCPQAP